MQPDAHLVARLFDAVARQVHVSAASLDLPAAQWAILRHLRQHARYGRTADQIAAYFSESRPAMKRTLASLVRKGLLACDTAIETSNARYALTPAGEEKLDHDPVTYLATAIATLSAADQAAFSLLLERMLATLSKAD